ncbi:hypothetical protein CK203_104654 [Vitis vinifera]|uniref:Uncharacterized protein n=1 Tax=Vitis vinifera TaxID=29760 RepID=A0A438DMI5_VITVI|nr:hypothetical protein CK203_104654 [Vitis vinifera]
MKWFEQVVLRVESCNMDVIVQIFKRNICPGMSFFKSLMKKFVSKDGRSVQTSKQLLYARRQRPHDYSTGPDHQSLGQARPCKKL